MSTEVTTAQMNRAICEFTGWEFRPDGDDWFKAYHEGELMWAASGKELNKILLEGFKFHKDWNKLMPVVEKISKIPLLNHDNTPCSDPRDVCHPITFAMPTEDGKQVMFRFKGFGLCIAETLIEAVHEACYEVAKYHNQQKQTNDTTGTL